MDIDLQPIDFTIQLNSKLLLKHTGLNITKKGLNFYQFTDMLKFDEVADETPDCTRALFNVYGLDFACQQQIS